MKFSVIQVLAILALVLLFVTAGFQKINQVELVFDRTSDFEAYELEQVFIERVIDGDTIVLRDGRTVRLIGIDTPEREEEGYERARSFLVQHVLNRLAYLVEEEQKVDQYGRLLAHVFVDELHINARMVEEGYAEVLMVPPNTKYKALFRQLRTYAKRNKRGLFDTGPAPNALAANERVALEVFQYDAPGDDSRALNQEFVIIRNNSNSPLSLLDWRVEDDSGRAYIFGDVVLDGYETITLHTGEGADTDEHVYWNQNLGVWNNAGDTFTLKDADGKISLTYSYGL